MARRTSNRDLSTWDDAPDLGRLVRDKRAGKRATPAKGRRHRCYENRLLKAHLADPLEEFDQAAWPEDDLSSSQDSGCDFNN